jgi:hypothetical protein
MVIAVTAGDADRFQPFVPFVGLKRLGPRSILIWATTMGRGEHGRTASFPPATWPLRLSAFRIDRGWEMQAAPNIQHRVQWVVVGGWHLEVRVFFATQHPDEELIAEAQAELDRLLLPGVTGGPIRRP